ncbi:D-ribose-binding periplasmic protein precursor [Gemmata obscuriglobus]|uniref:Sugar ABC transporter substrate-binding protein n=1 Tax=Gemmata obscuriglobus TaxID=114 RepID=A0A2Z3GS39_9BACT|nr:substrate-binding domain-containing protein [Gemmata obscuriglobus]AWM37189.1 sugar ABC transporter substrate-binding protein [Gemmata obscuriglobus]QEG30074.1 D-ribose-binding periplasmic protein precursor [Gemmata obscuriglobus]VTS09395.1 Periplasmic binding protein/LacI transcriptional regulator OS=Pedosphaera parvula (strain Ellin514) GN=Cflav_PD2832 PE=4 SV=1: Peripla_BP_4 [Gemmata obscuriglobus UQM 2246]
MARVHLYLLLAAVLPIASGCARRGEEYTIVVIPKGLSHEHWQSVRRGAERCAADLEAEDGTRVRVIFDGPLRERDALEQIRIVDRRVATGASALVLAPQHSATMTACVKRAADAGVPVVIIDSGLDDPNHFVKYVATDNYNGGRLAGRHLIRELQRRRKDKPKLILFRYAVGSQATEDRERGFEDEVKERCPGAEWLSTDKYAGATRDSAMREAGPLILQFGNQVDGIFAPNESSASGTADVLRAQGLNQKVALMAFDGSKPLLQSIQQGDVIGSILQDPYRMGYLSAWYCVRHLRGEDMNNGRREMSEGTGEYLITAENVTSAFTLGLYDPEAQARRTTEELRKGPKK